MRVFLMFCVGIAVFPGGLASAIDSNTVITVRAEALGDGRTATILEGSGENDDYAVITSVSAAGVLSAGPWVNGKQSGSWTQVMPAPDTGAPTFLCGTMKENQSCETWAMIFPGHTGATVNHVNGFAHGQHYTETFDGSGAVSEFKNGKMTSSVRYGSGELPPPANGLRFFTRLIPQGQETGMVDAKKTGFIVVSSENPWDVGRTKDGKPTGLWVRFKFSTETDDPITITSYGNTETKLFSIWAGKKARYQLMREGKTIEDTGEVKIVFK